MLYTSLNLLDTKSMAMRFEHSFAFRLALGEGVAVGVVAARDLGLKEALRLQRFSHSCSAFVM